MKKLVIFALSIFLCFSLVACSQATLSEEDILKAAQEIMDQQDSNVSNTEDDTVTNEENADNLDVDTGDSYADNNQSVSGEVINDIDTENLAQNIDVEMIPLIDGELLFKLTNNNSIDISAITLTVTFYDSAEKIIANFEQYLSVVGAGHDVYALSYDLSDKVIDINNVKVKIETDNYDYGFENAIDNIQLSANISEDNTILAEVTNNGTKTISNLTAFAIYYKDNTIVAANYNSAYDIEAGDYEVLEFWTPYDKNYDDVDFDKYEVYISEAYIY